MRPLCLFLTAVATALVLATAPAHAGRSCEAKRSTAVSVQRGLQLAVRTRDALEVAYAQQGTQVVFLARAGQDLSRYGLRYSHLAIAYRTDDAQGQPTWRVLHKLNNCGTADAQIYRQGLAEFFLDDPWRFEAAWVVPMREVQARLLPVVRSNDMAVRMHERAYNIVSYPWSTRYQQSNQWAIETLAFAMEPGAVTRTAAQGWLQAKNYEPTTLRIGPLQRLGGRLTSANVAFDDHPDAKRFTDRIETVTVDSVFEWLERSGLGGGRVTLGL